MEKIDRLRLALDKAIEKLREYADEDEIAGLNGYGCFSRPVEAIEIWIKEIEEVSK